MTSKNLANVHVVPHRNGWAITRELGNRGRRVYAQQEVAIREAHRLATRDGVEMIIHRGNDEFEISLAG